MSDVTEPDDDIWVSALLSELAAPPMPEPVAARLRAVIAAESAVRTAGADSTEGASVTNLAESPRSPRPMWPWAIAGGIAAAAAVMAVLVAQPFTASTPADVPLAAGAESSVVPISTGTNYTAANVADMVPIHLTRDTTPAAAPMAARQATFVATKDGVNDCLAGLDTPPSHLRMIDLANYDSLPAAVLVFLDNDTDSTADVVVVGVRCSQADPQVQLRGVARITPAAKTPGE